MINTTLCEKIIEYTKQELKYHIVNTTAQLVVATPIFAVYETMIARMTPQESLSARKWSAALAVMGIGYFDAKFRDYMRHRKNITEESPEKEQRSLDKKSKMIFNAGRATINYLLGGVYDVRKIGLGVLLGVSYGRMFGGTSGYSMDLFKDLSGIKQSRRISPFVSNLNPVIKKFVMAGITASSIGITTTIYEIAPKINQYIDSAIRAIH